MTTIRLKCACGAVEMKLTGQSLLQYYCHCDDCQRVHGAAYACALYPADAVAISGQTRAVVLKTTPRMKCGRCEMYLYAEVPGIAVRGVNGSLLPGGTFRPEFHMQCKFAREPVRDELPHFKGLPPRFGGSCELMQW
jgi:hypothetical protein